MMEESGYEELDNQMRELIQPVREYFPSNPESAFRYFRTMYPDIVAGTLVSMVWGFMEHENMLKNPFLHTKPLTLKEMTIVRDPNIRN